MKKYFLTILSIALIASFVITSRETQKLTSLVILQQEMITYTTECMNGLETKIDALEQTFGEDIGQIRIVNEYLMQELEGVDVFKR